MKRRQFLETTMISALGILLNPTVLHAHKYQPKLSYDELIGKGNPPLFGDSYQIRREAFLAYKRMKDAALKSGIKLEVVSSYRDFNHQNRIWERKFKKFTNQGLDGLSAIKKIIEYSTIPGTSRHHWGTDMDVIDAAVPRPQSVLSPVHFEENGRFRKMKLWMEQHSESYGFYLVYTNEPSRKGFKYEPWHYSYKPLSQLYLKEYLELDLKELLEHEQLMGQHYFTSAFLDDYLNENIRSINPELL